MHNNEHDRTRIFWVGVKFATVILCLVGFVANSFIIFQQFSSGKTVTSTDVQKNSKLFLPSITMCGLSGFKKKVDKYADIELENYINNTLSLNEILFSVEDNDGNTLRIESVSRPAHFSNQSNLWKVSTTYSAFKGRCHTIEYKKEVTDNIE